MGTETKLANNDLLVGREIRALRKNRKLTLAELAKMADCSVGYLSEVERGARTISIKFLRAVANALSVPLGWFFAHEGQPANEAGKIVRAQSRKRIGTGEDGLFEELLSPDLGGSFEMFLTQIGPGCRSDGTIMRRVEEEGYVLEGSLDLMIDGDLYRLKTGDSFRIPQSTFSWINNGKIRASIIWVTSPPVY
ncbi:MAG: helix-turn-helix transcriptional regulator [Sphingomonadales bacterium]|nr:helix-turn-helix transcriptional regulator [Sphingomonadales bacterium]